jgi:hypothetical protein
MPNSKKKIRMKIEHLMVSHGPSIVRVVFGAILTSAEFSFVPGLHGTEWVTNCSGIACGLHWDCLGGCTGIAWGVALALYDGVHFSLRFSATRRQVSGISQAISRAYTGSLNTPSAPSVVKPYSIL